MSARQEVALHTREKCPRFKWPCGTRNNGATPPYPKLTKVELRKFPRNPEFCTPGRAKGERDTWLDIQDEKCATTLDADYFVAS